MTQTDQPTLLNFLEIKNSKLFGKSIEIRDAIKDWLAYIPQSFPHYTQHTIEHSDEIILQISKLIFENDDPTRPVVQLSAVEAYILIAAAYLHDAGMVVSDKEKAEIIQSEEWTSWTIDGSGAKRWDEIKELRNKADFSNSDVRNFIADLQTRFLIAEFVRRKHHIRAGSIITEYQPLLGRFAFDNKLLLQAISNVCVGHGLDKYDLEDSQRFPDRSDIMGESVNVRFLAILLRLGDLLDMRSDRACPLLLNASNPLPSDSLAHWTQYQRLTHRLTATDKIEITAECENQEEHRFLQDWCQWLANETVNARELMARCTRHGAWKPPTASLYGNSRTIIIQPSKSAKYIPNDWVFRLDPDMVYERLIRDLYADENAFIRELLQNAFDATRCKLYDDLKSANLETPEYPTEVPNEWLKKYPVNISLETRLVQNELSGQKEERQFVIIDDFGIGMDRAVIEHYLLQVGHSFYTTEEFRRNYRFVGTSRFGLGFLSVFAVSDNIAIETFKPTSEGKDGAIRLILTGPKNYLLTEKCDRLTSGTKIEIRLKRKFEIGQLTKAVAHWCKRVEFNVVVDEFDQQTIITAEKPEQFIQEAPLASNKKSKFIIKDFSINLRGVYGEFYIFTYLDNRGEQWDEDGSSYEERYPQAYLPSCPGDLICLHGISSDFAYTYRPRGSAKFSLRVDYRNDKVKPSLSRDRLSIKEEFGIRDPDIQGIIQQILMDHLDSSPLARDEKNGWTYKQRLSERFSFLPTFWFSYPKTIRIMRGGKHQLLSLRELTEISSFLTCFDIERKEISSLKTDEFWFLPKDIKQFSKTSRSSIFIGRKPVSVKKKGESRYVISWEKDEELKTMKEKSVGRRPVSYISLPDKTIGIAIHKTYDDIFEHLLLNIEHPFVKWLQAIQEISATNELKIGENAVRRTLALTERAIDYRLGMYYRGLVDYVENWREIPNLPPYLIPPTIKEEDFILHTWEYSLRRSSKRNHKQIQKKKSTIPIKKKIVKKTSS